MALFQRPARMIADFGLFRVVAPFVRGRVVQPRIKPCLHCERQYDSFGGEGTRGKHFAPYCSHYCREADKLDIPYEGSASKTITLPCHWCGKDEMELSQSHNHSSRTTCSAQCRMETRKVVREWYILLMLKIFQRPMSAEEIAREIQKIGGHLTAKFTKMRVANYAKRLKARGALISHKDSHHPRTYTLADYDAPLKQFCKIPHRLVERERKKNLSS